jgi:uncharacterized protein with NAD-binding domain and iron-sulfur cluster
VAKPRIAILGGGAGAVTAAFYLSKPGWEQHFESITLYQQGWRLGGKGASGRGSDDRIEEHGLHIWFGFYENAFRMLNRCHLELDHRDQDQPRWPLCFDAIADSFIPCREISVTDYDGCGWKLWVADFFDYDDDDVPWGEGEKDKRLPGERPDDWTVGFYLVRCLELAADLAWSLVRPDQPLRIVAGGASEAAEAMAGLDRVVHALWTSLGGDVQQILSAAADAVDAFVAEGVDQPAFLFLLDLLLRALETVTDYFRTRYDELVRESDVVRRAWYVVDILVAIARGVIEDGVIEADSFAEIDDVDFRDWLLAHGAARDSVDCALVRAVVYDLAFGYENGDPQRPSCGAGTALRGLLRTFFTYRGALMWKMGAGMGDVVFAPLYELLVKRGVSVRFFHQVEAVRAATGGTKEIEEIDINVQADVDHVPPSAYLGGTGTPPTWTGRAVWPASPSKLLKGQDATVPPEVFESWYARGVAKSQPKVLRKGEGTDGFDVVVLGLPIGCLPDVAPDLVQAERWRRAVEKIQTVPTQALQVWLDREAPVLGARSGTVVGGFVEPFDTWADMPHLVSQEKVSGSKTVAYFCNVLPDAPAPDPQQALQWLAERKELVLANAERFLARDIKTLWPKAVDDIGAFKWEFLIAPPGTVGIDRLDHQYFRANVEPSERYVLSVPGSSAVRIPPADTDFANLYAVGDWTACKLDAGCVEAAVISGMLAANAIHEKYGDPNDVEPVIGWDSP